MLVYSKEWCQELLDDMAESFYIMPITDEQKTMLGEAFTAMEIMLNSEASNKFFEVRKELNDQGIWEEKDVMFEMKRLMNMEKDRMMNARHG